MLVLSIKFTGKCGIIILMEIPITQTKDWQVLQDHLGENSTLQKTPNYQYLAIIKKTPIGSYIYCPYGPIAKDKSGFKEALKSLNTLAHDYDAIFIRVEPFEAEFAKCIPKTAKHNQAGQNPQETWLLDLTGKDEEFKAKLPSRLLRYHRQAAKNGLTIEKTHNPDDIKYLLTLQRALARQKGINTFSENYLRTELEQPFATLYLAKYQNPDTKKSEIVAAGLVFDDKTTRYNLQGAQSDQGRKLHATGILTVELINDAREKGLKTFDFWGIAPDGAPKDHPWAGFTNFKKTFKGYQKNHAGTYDIVIKPFKYRLFNLLRKINKLRKH